MGDARAAYETLLKRTKEVALLESCASLLSWDQETMMPEPGVGLRSQQLSLLAGISHRKSTAPEIGELLQQAGELDEAKAGDTPEAANLREIRRDYDHATKVPPELMEEMARVRSLARNAWVEARQKKEFALFQPWLEKTLVLVRRHAEALGYEQDPYDALLDLYEPEETRASLEALFSPLRKSTAALLDRILGSGAKVEEEILHRVYPEQRQRAFARRASALCGFDFSKGRLDDTAHPFCSDLGPGDTRLTNRYTERYFGDGFFGLLHEGGHGMYEQGLPAEAFGTPLGSAASFGVHESQSRMWENMVGRSRPFWMHFFPLAQAEFPEALSGVTLERFYKAINAVQPTFIRVEADEVTYNLHVFLRFELECALVSGDLSTKDLPGAWNEKFERSFQRKVPDDAMGCLQDIHWSGGSFGYFPTYTLGNLYAAQLYARAKRDLPDLEKGFSKGALAPLREWLGEKIYRHGRRYPPRELVERATGEARSPDALVGYLEGKYAKVYGL